MKYFKENEFNNFEMMDSKLLDMLDKVREIYGKPIRITSSYRSPEHPIEAAKKQPGEHAYGAAVDIESIGGASTYNIVKAAIEVGFKRIGISRKKGFIHLGIGYPGAPSKSIWTY
tara:strand:- start:468 stop:812 length:345 start_codon:yes stop_codon:yes gene_type:complete